MQYQKHMRKEQPQPSSKEGRTYKLQPTRSKHRTEMQTQIWQLSLQGLLPPGHILVLNQEIRTLLLLADGPRLLLEQQFSVNEMTVLVPILQAFPHYCPYEVLQAHLFSNPVTAVSIDQCRQRLEEARKGRTWQQELRPLRRVLSRLRKKLHVFLLDIASIRQSGCSLTKA